MIKKILSWLPKRKSKFQLQSSQHVIVPAFTSGGVQYYCFDDTFNMPYERGLYALEMYEQLRQRISKEWLQEFAKSMRAILSKPDEIDLTKLSQLLIYLEERLAFQTEPELMWKLASVVYFDEKENPYKLDVKYGESKIKAWQTDHTVESFFLQMPLQKLLPYLKPLHEAQSLNIYSAIVEAIKTKQNQFLKKAQLN